MQEYLTKGKQVYLEGRLQTREYDGKDGNKRYTTEVVASKLVLLGRRGDGNGDAPYSERPEQPHHAAPDSSAGTGPTPELTEDDIPF